MAAFERRRLHERFLRATHQELDFLRLAGFERTGAQRKSCYSIVRFDSEGTLRPRSSTVAATIRAPTWSTLPSAAVHPDWPRWPVLTLAGPSLFYASTPVEIDVAVGRIARLLETECEAFVRGEPEAVEQLERNAKRETREAVQRWEIKPLRLDAEQAFRRRAYGEAVGLYEQVNIKLAALGERLRRVDQARLAYARKRSSPTD